MFDRTHGHVDIKMNAYVVKVTSSMRTMAFEFKAILYWLDM